MVAALIIGGELSLYYKFLLNFMMLPGKNYDNAF